MNFQVGDRVRVIVVADLLEKRPDTRPVGMIRRLPLPREEWRNEKDSRSDRYAIVEFDGRFAALNPKALEKVE